MRALALAAACALAALLAPRAPAARADDSPGYVVIVNPKRGGARLDKKTVADAFLKKQSHWDDDEPILPIDQNKGSAVRARFSRGVLDRSVSAVRTYWNQLVFSGRGVPPPEVDSDAEVLKYVAAHEGAIGYVSEAAKLDGVSAVQVR